MDDFEKSELRGSESQIRQVIELAGSKFKGRACNCPFHPDKNPSAGIYFKNSVWKFHCHPCEIDEDIIGLQARLENKKPGDVLKEKTTNGFHGTNGHSKKSEKLYPNIDAIKMEFGATDVFPYTDPKTLTADLIVLRRDNGVKDKDIRQCHRNPDGQIAWGAPPKPESGYPLFNRIRIALADTIFVVEGEKKVKILTRLGFAATSSAMGAGKYDNADWSPLNAKKCVLLWPDNDDAGIEHMKGVFGIVSSLNEPPEIRWIDPEIYAIPPKGDVEQYIELIGGDDDDSRKRAIQCVIDTAAVLNGSSELNQLIEDTIAGRRVVVSLPWHAMDSLSQALMPGTVTCICGDPGASKTLMLTQAAIYWHKMGVKVAAYMLEDDKKYHLNRALALMEGNADLTQIRWMYDNAAETRSAMEKHRKLLDSFSRCLFDAPDKMKTLPQLADWVDQRAAAGCRVIAIDPITAAEAPKERFLADADFMFRVKTSARKYGSSIILITHPKSGAKNWTDVAGGTCFPRFSHTVFWINVHEPAKKFECTVYQGTSEYCKTVIHANRTVKLGKVRNGPGNGAMVAFTFEKKTLRFLEHGPVVKAKKDKEDETD